MKKIYGLIFVLLFSCSKDRTGVEYLENNNFKNITVTGPEFLMCTKPCPNQDYVMPAGDCMFAPTVYRSSNKFKAIRYNKKVSGSICCDDKYDCVVRDLSLVDEPD